MLLRLPVVVLVDYGDEGLVVEALFQVRVVSVFDLIVCASGNISSNLTPPGRVSQEEMSDEDVLLQAPLLLHDVRVEMVMPALTALFSDATGQVTCDRGPILGSTLRHDSCEGFVLCGCPRGRR